VAKKLSWVAALALVASGVGLANAQVWAEMGEAGELPGTAQTPAGVGALTTITGSLGASDTDMYLISIPAPGAGFEAKTSGNSTTIDTQLFLFDPAGMGVVHNDDDPGGSLQSKITNMFVVAPGNYLLAVSQYNRDPSSAGGLIWANSPFNVERTPDGPGAGSPVTSWGGSTSGGAYQIDLRGVEFVPEPASLSLLALGGLALIRRRR
jgi:hypothetical protein